MGWLYALITLGLRLEGPHVPSDAVMAALFLVELIASPLAAGLAYRFMRAGRPATGLVLILLGFIAAAAMPAALVAAVQLFARRERRLTITTTATLAIAAMAAETIYLGTGGIQEPSWWLAVVAYLVLWLILYLIGRTIGQRRALLASLRETAAAAQRERDLVVQQARVTERHRIAREMHDSLAHHLGLISLHAGALGRRDDLPAETIKETSATVAELARTASLELRSILGVLRTDAETTTPPGSIDEISTLLAQHREAGMSVEAVLDPALPQESPHTEAASRLLFRVAQQSLSNAARHAPGARVRLTLTFDGDTAHLTCRNPIRPDAGSPPEQHMGMGMGLEGMSERARLAGGSLQAGTVGKEFVVEVEVPW